MTLLCSRINDVKRVLLIPLKIEYAIKCINPFKKNML